MPDVKLNALVDTLSRASRPSADETSLFEESGAPPAKGPGSPGALLAGQFDQIEARGIDEFGLFGDDGNLSYEELLIYANDPSTPSDLAAAAQGALENWEELEVAGDGVADGFVRMDDLEAYYGLEEGGAPPTEEAGGAGATGGPSPEEEAPAPEAGPGDPTRLTSGEFKEILAGSDPALASGHAAVKLAFYMAEIPGGLDGSLSMDDLKAAAENTSLPGDVRAAAQYFVDHPEQFSAMQKAAPGSEAHGEDGFFNTADLLAFAEKQGVPTAAASAAIAETQAEAAPPAETPPAETPPGTAPGGGPKPLSQLTSEEFDAALASGDAGVAGGYAAAKIALWFNEIENLGGGGSGDGILSFAELQHAANNRKLPADVRAAAAWMVDHRDEFNAMQSASPAGQEAGQDDMFNLGDLEAYYRSKGISLT